ncbi:MAG: V/A-type H+-transporting ATPase subunit A [Natronomonas sp.]|jgi:V/A-type H+-transporting ATPase subunit A
MSQATESESDVSEDGVIASVSGPVATATGMDAQMNDMVRVGHDGLMGEVIEIEGDRTTIQVYEETSGVAPGEPVENTGEPLTVDLGPGLLDSIYDGVQRPLPVLEDEMGSFLDRGVDAPGIDLGKTWEFTPTVEEGETIEPGDVVGTVPETESIEHKVMVPPDFDGGEVTETKRGNFTVDEPVVVLEDGEEVTMHQEWPVREARPTVDKETPSDPLLSGQRILDGLFPLAKGGTAAIPGPFGSGKCVTPDTPVTLADGETLPIEELFDRLTEDVPASGEVLREAETDVLTFDEGAGEIRPATTSHVYRGSTDAIVRIETASGRELAVTPAHKLFRIRGDLQIEPTPAGDLSTGDSLVMPRSLPIEGSEVTTDPYESVPEARAATDSTVERFRDLVDSTDVSKKSLAGAADVSYDVFMNYALGRTRPTLSAIAGVFDHLDVERPAVERVKPGSNGKPVRIPSAVDESFAEFLGFVLSDGMITERTVRFHNGDERLRERFATLTERLFDVETAATVYNTVETVEIRSTVIASLLSAMGVPETDKSVTAAVPDSIKRGPDDVVAAFLRGYYLGDGSFSGGTAEIATSSDAMASDLTYLLARLGVLVRIAERENGANRVVVTGADELGALHGAIATGDALSHEKLDAMGDHARTTTANTNVDTVPVDPETMADIADAARYSDFAEAGIETTNYTGLGERPSRRTFESIREVIADGGGTLADRAATVSELLDDIFFDPIVDVEIVEEERTVYDVTVPDTHNFVGGEVPAVLHNTVMQHQLAKWSDADIVVYIGCGERGNEMTEVIDDFPDLEDPVTGKPLMSRTSLIANTSNMPVAARESGVYAGITIAEYYRDMGYDVALMADSTSRWAEAMREISSRLEEMPGEEGYPADLAARLSAFYERAGYYQNINGTEGSISVIGAVSPPGGDFSEPVTQNTLRIVQVFWALDNDLAERRHFPAINWDESYSLYRDQLDPWFKDEVADDWPEIRQWVIDTLDEESELQEIVDLVGKDALPEDQQLTLEVARYIREAFLQQNAMHDVDTYCEPEKTYRMMQAIETFSDEAFDALDAGVPVDEITDVDAVPRLNRMGTAEEYEEFIDEVEANITEQIRGLYQ